MANDVPDQPKTQQLPAADKQEIMLAELKVLLVSGLQTLDAKVDESARATATRFDQQDRVLGKVVTDGIEANTRLTRIEVRIDKVEDRAEELEKRIDRTSIRARENSNVDLDHEAKLAAEIVARREERTKAVLEREAIVADVAKIKELTAAQDKTLAAQDVKLDLLVTIAKATAGALGSKRLRYFLLICAAIGALAGGAAAGWNAHAVSKIALPALTP